MKAIYLLMCVIAIVSMGCERETPISIDNIKPAMQSVRTEYTPGERIQAINHWVKTDPQGYNGTWRNWALETHDTYAFAGYTVSEPWNVLFVYEFAPTLGEAIDAVINHPLLGTMGPGEPGDDERWKWLEHTSALSDNEHVDIYQSTVPLTEVHVMWHAPPIHSYPGMPSSYHYNPDGPTVRHAIDKARGLTPW